MEIHVDLLLLDSTVNMMLKTPLMILMAENSMAENYEYSLPKIEKQNARTSQEVVEEGEAGVVVEDVIVTDPDPDPAGGHGLGPGHVTEDGQDPSLGDQETDPGTAGEGPGLHVTDLVP